MTENGFMQRRKRIYDFLELSPLSVNEIYRALDEPRGDIYQDCQVMLNAGVLKRTGYKYSHSVNDFSVYEKSLGKESPKVFRCKFIAALFGETGMAKA